MANEQGGLPLPDSRQLLSSLIAITGGCSRPSKMPGPAYGLPARACRVGSALQAVAGSVCGDCYALRGRYRARQTQRALERRLEALKHPRWVEAMADLIGRQAAGAKVFRWHDSGDLQSVDHLRMIVRVCLLTPQIRHWLPTREYEIVRRFHREHGSFPANLTVRLSAHLLNGPPPTMYGLPTSTVSTDSSLRPDGAYLCPQPHQGSHACGNCRACWDPMVEWVDYLRR